jgi:hypothetical protein
MSTHVAASTADGHSSQFPFASQADLALELSSF